jgi:hypothetical protein
MQGSQRAARTGRSSSASRGVLNKGTAAVASRRFDQLFDLNQRFHSELSAAGQNTVLGDLLQRMRERTAMLFAPMDPARQARSWEEHAAILRAIIQGDERTAATLAAEHVMHAGMDFLVGLNTGGGWPTTCAARTTQNGRRHSSENFGIAPAISADRTVCERKSAAGRNRSATQPQKQAW